MAVDGAENPKICKNCLLLSTYQESAKSKCKKWLENCEINDASSLSSEFASASSQSLEYSQILQYDDLGSKNVVCSNLMDLDEHLHEANAVVKTKQSTFGNVNIYKSRKVHVGNITYITGPICFNQNTSVAKKGFTTNKICLDEIPDYTQHSGNTLVVHLSQTVKVRGKSWRHIFSHCLFGFMELCMQLVDGA